MKKQVTFIFCASMLMVFDVFAAAADIAPDLQQCSRVDEDAARLACYDQLAGRDEEASRNAEAALADTTPTEPSPENSTTPPPASSLPAPTALDLFGATGEMVEKYQPEVPDSITARISRIEENAHGRRTVHLDNGQVWAENSPTRHFRISEGETVTIESGAFGSYRMTKGSRFSRVRRIK